MRARNASQSSACSAAQQHDGMGFEPTQASDLTLYKGIVEASPVPVMSLGVDGCVTIWNMAANRLFGYSAVEVLGRPLPTVPPGYEDLFRRLLARTLKGESISQLETPARRHDGSTIPVSMAMAPLCLGGAVAGVMMTCTDLSRHRRQEHQRERRTEQLRDIVQTQQEIASGGRDLQGVLDLIVERVRALTEADGAVLEMADGDEMVYRAASGTSSPHIGLRLRLDTSLSGLCVRTGTILRCDDTETDPRVDRDACRRVQARSMIVVPLHHAGTVQGALKVLSSEPAAFDDDDISMLSLMAGQIAAAMSNAAALEAERALVRERTASLEAVRESEQRVRTLVDTAPVGVCIVDEEGTFLQVNDAFASTLGYGPEELIGQHFSCVVPRDQLARLSRLRAERLSTTSGSTDEFELRHRDGERITALMTSVSLPGGKGHIERVTFTVDITDRKRLERVLYHQAHHDPLTGLPNRKLLGDRLHQAIRLARRRHDIAAVLFLDLDGFKQVNDRYGHEEGDQLLKIVAGRLTTSVRASDTVARLAGDEFVLVLSAVQDGDAALGIAEKILRCIQDPIELDKACVTVSGSVGIALYPEHGEAPLKLLDRADEAMYRAKQRGKNTSCLAPHIHCLS